MTTLTPSKRTGRPRKAAVPEARHAQLGFRPTIYEAIQAMRTGTMDGQPVRELALYGTRGDGKTWGVLGGMLAHAQAHAAAGHPLPVTWLGVRDTWASHRDNTIPTMQAADWKGAWQIQDGGRVAVGGLDAGGGRFREVVRLRLFGIEDQGAMNRVRTETAGVWFEEPSPAGGEVDSSGVREEAWTLAMTSQRMATHARIAVMTLNYPDEDHWTWTRFAPPACPVRREDRATWTGVHPAHPSRRWLRVPPGERALAVQRAEWLEALSDRPDLVRRLLEGLPGTVLLGQQVAQGFREDLHVSPTRLLPVENEPLLLGQDFGLTPATILGQVVNGERRVVAALPCPRGGIVQHGDDTVIPWLQTHAPWVLRRRDMLVGTYDVAGETAEQTDSDRDPVGQLERKLPGLWYPGPVEWETRKHTLLSMLHHRTARGEVALRIDPVHGLPLIKALSGRWYYPTDRTGAIRRDLPKKPNHPWEDLGDAFIYWCWAVSAEAGAPRGPVTVESTWDLRGLGNPAVVSAWDWRGR